MKNKLLKILESINPNVNFENCPDYISDGLLDSFDIINIVVTIDSELGISIPGTDIIPDNFRNLESIIALVDKIKNAR